MSVFPVTRKFFVRACSCACVFHAHQIVQTTHTFRVLKEAQQIVCRSVSLSSFWSSLSSKILIGAALFDKVGIYCFISHLVFRYFVHEKARRFCTVDSIRVVVESLV